MMKQYRVAVVGAGFMGSMHASIFGNTAKAILVAIVDQNEELATRVAANFSGCKVYTSYDALFGSEQLDLVSICTPDNLHLGPALAAANRGVNVFIEKPIASKEDEARQIVSACRQAGVKLGVGYLLRFDPRYSQAKNLIDAGKIGRAIHVYTRRNSARTEGPKRYAGKLPLCLHVTVHDIDLVLWMLKDQKPISVYAQQTDILLGSLGTQDSIAAIVRFSGGTLVNFESSWALPSGAQHMIDARMEFIGTEGMFEVQCGDSGLYFADDSRSQAIDTQHWPMASGRVGGDLKQQLLSLLDWLEGAEVPIASGEEAIQSLALTLAMVKSAETGTVIQLSEK